MGVGLLVGPVAGLAVASGGRASAAATVQPVAQSAQLSAVSCTSASTAYCIAVGFESTSSGPEGVVVPVTGGSPGTPVAVPGTTALDAVACAGSPVCVAVGSGPGGGVMLTIGFGQPTSPVTVAGAAALYGVACPATESCVAVGAATAGEGFVVDISGTTPGAGQVVPGTVELDGVDCAGATSACVAVGDLQTTGPVYQLEGAVVPVGSTGAGAVVAVVGSEFLSGVSCASASCVAVGTAGLAGGGLQGVAYTIERGLPGPPIPVPGSQQLFGVSCLDMTTCGLVGKSVGQTGVFTTLTSGTPASPELVSGSLILLGLSCPISPSCEAVGADTADEGVVVTDEVALPPPPPPPPPPPSPYSLIAYPVQAVVGKPFNGANGGSDIEGAITVLATSSGTPTPSSAEVNWGDGSSTAGTIRPGPISGAESVFYVRAEHTYSAPINSGTITVTVQVATTGLTASAPVVVLQAEPEAYFVVNPSIGTQNQVSLLMPVAQGPGQKRILGYEWTSTADTSHPVYDTPATRGLYGCVINALIDSGGGDGSGTCQNGQYISSFIQGAIQLGILPVTTNNFIGGLTSSDILTIAQLWKQYYPQHIIPYVFPYFSELQTSHVAFSLAIGVPGDRHLPSCLGVDSAVCSTVPDVTVEPDCAPVTAILGVSSTCDLGDFQPRKADYVGLNVTAAAGALVYAQGALSLVVSHGIDASPSTNDVYLQFSVGAGIGVGASGGISVTSGWVNGPFSSTPTDSQVNDYVDHCTVSGGGGLGVSLGPVSLGAGGLGVYSPGGDPGFTTGFETYLSAGGAEGSAMAGVSVNYALSLGELGIPLSSSELNILQTIFNGVSGGSMSSATLTADVTPIVASLPNAQTAINDISKALAALQAVQSGCALPSPVSAG